ncbi:MAG: MarR family transcriptional regulator [Clostridia bacterium]|nr:MarR family transcriptional regulator [Clostridia bacterium]
MPDTSLENIRRIIREISFLEKHRRRYLNEHLRDHHLHGSMPSAILFLHRHPGCNQDALCEELTADKGNGARMCRQLEKLGYIERIQSTADRREYNLFLTKVGQDLVPEILNIVHEWRGIVMKNMTDKENAKLLEFLTKMADNVNNAV